MNWLKQRYKIIPQMKEYDELPMVNIPFLMHSSKDYNSSTINISNGLRVSSGKNIIVGGSFVFGIGATRDIYTVPGYMNWRNFGGRAYVSTQELLLYLIYGGRPDNVIILSGLNDLVVPMLVSNYPPEIGAYFFWDKYKTGNFNTVKNLAPLQRNLKIWKDLSLARGFKVIYVLQPFFNWTAKEPSPEEERLFNLLDKCRPKHWHILKELNLETYVWYKNQVQSICPFPFYDMNEILKGRYHGEWLWVDRAHMTDKGYKAVAEECGILSFQ